MYKHFHTSVIFVYVVISDKFKKAMDKNTMDNIITNSNKIDKNITDSNYTKTIVVTMTV